MRFPRQSEVSAGGREWRRWVGAHTAGPNSLSARAYCTHSWNFCWHALCLVHTHICWSTNTRRKWRRNSQTQTVSNVLSVISPHLKMSWSALKVINMSLLIFMLLLRSGDYSVIHWVFPICGTACLTLTDVVWCVQACHTVNWGSIHGSSQNYRELGPVSLFFVMSDWILPLLHF